MYSYDKFGAFSMLGVSKLSVTGHNLRQNILTSRNYCDMIILPDKLMIVGVSMQPSEKSKKLSAAEKKKRGVIKAKSDFFREARYGLTQTEHRIVYFAILTGQQNGTPFEPVTVSVQEFKEVCALSGNSTYSNLKNITKNLIERSVEVVYKDEKGKHLLQSSWVTDFTYHEKEGTITITPNKKLQMFFNNKVKPFSTTEFYYLVKFTCQYSERLYELLKSLDFKSIVDFSIAELREKLAVKNKYPNYADFLKRVLSPAIEDINKFTDLDIDFREQRGDYNKVTTVVFSLKKKTVPLLYDREKSGEFRKHTINDEPIEGQTSFWESFDFLKEGDIGVLIDKNGAADNDTHREDNTATYSP